jgi:hypothetical protein
MKYWMLGTAVNIIMVSKRGTILERSLLYSKSSTGKTYLGEYNEHREGRVAGINLAISLLKAESQIYKQLTDSCKT